MPLPTGHVGHASLESGGITIRGPGSKTILVHALKAVRLTVELQVDDGEDVVQLDLDPETFHMAYHRGFAREPATETFVVLHGVIRCTSS